MLELTRRGHSLSYLRSWATVGIPYFRYVPRPISIWQLATILVVIGLLVASAGQAIEFGKHAGTFIEEQTLGASLVPVLIASAWLVSGIMIVELVARHLLPRKPHEATPAASSSAGRRSTLMRGVLIVLTAATGLLVLWWFDRTAAGPLTIGKVAQSARGLKVAVIPFIWFALSAVLAVLLSRLTVQLATHLRLRTEREVEARTARLAMPGYLPICSRSDEAINGLRTTLATPGHIVPRVRSLGPMQTQFILALVSAPFRLLYNGLFARAGDEYVWNTIIHRLQGSDDPRFMLFDVTTSPDERSRTPGILTDEDEEILSAAADLQGSVLLPSARRALALAATSYRHGDGAVTVLKDELSLDGLVHTTYFSVNSVRKLLADHLFRHMTPAQREFDMVSQDPADALDRPPGLQGRLFALGSPLSIVTNGAFVGIALIIWVSASTLWGAWIYPETDKAIVEDVLNAPPVTLASNEPASTIALAGWVEALVRTGRDDLAIKVFDRISGVEGRIVAMSAAADQLRSLNRIELADRLLVQADWLARASFNVNEMTGEKTRDGYWHVIRALVYAGKSSEAEEFVRRVANGKQANAEQLSVAIAQLSIGYSAIGQLNDALAAAERIPDELSKPWAYAKVLAVFPRPPSMNEGDLETTWYASTVRAGIGEWAAGYIARKLAIAGRSGDAEKWAARVTWDHVKAGALLEIGLSYMPRDTGRAQHSAEQAADLLMEHDDPSKPLRPSAAAFLAMLGQRGRAEMMLSRERQPGIPDDLSEIQGAIAWLMIGGEERASAAVRKVSSGTALGSWDPSFDRLLTLLSRSGKDLGIIAAVKRWPENAIKAQTLSRLGVAAVAPNQREALLFAATEAARNIESGPLLLTVLPELATAWARVGASRRARAACEVCPASDRLKIDALLLQQHDVLASHLPAGTATRSLSNPLSED